MVTKPKGDYYGGLVSAPVFKNIITRIHSLGKGKIETPTTDLEIKTTQIQNEETESEIVQKNSRMVSSSDKTQNVFISTYNQNVMPDLKGKTIKEAGTDIK